jgi:hypothetical protein
MWRIEARLFLGDYDAGKRALAGLQLPTDPGGNRAPFAGIVSMCPLPLQFDAPSRQPVSELTEWLHLPIFDGGNGEEEFEAALGVAVPFIVRRRRRGNVLVHCAAGMSRSVSVLAGYLCAQGFDVDDAYDHIAIAKCRALGLSPIEAGDLIAPASEFRACLARLFGVRSR